MSKVREDQSDVKGGAMNDQDRHILQEVQQEVWMHGRTGHTDRAEDAVSKAVAGAQRRADKGDESAMKLIAELGEVARALGTGR